MPNFVIEFIYHKDKNINKAILYSIHCNGFQSFESYDVGAIDVASCSFFVLKT